MTTTVKVMAHCDGNKTKVRVIEGSRDSAEKTESYLEDGQEQQYVVYDDKYLSVDEIPK